MKNQKLFKRALSISRFFSLYQGYSGDYGFKEEDWTDEFILDELLYVCEILNDPGSDYQYILECGSAEEKKDVRSQIGKCKRLIAAYEKLGVKPKCIIKALENRDGA